MAIVSLVGRADILSQGTMFLPLIKLCDVKITYLVLYLMAGESEDKFVK